MFIPAGVVADEAGNTNFRSFALPAFDDEVNTTMWSPEDFLPFANMPIEVFAWDLPVINVVRAASRIDVIRNKSAEVPSATPTPGMTARLPVTNLSAVENSTAEVEVEVEVTLPPEATLVFWYHYRFASPAPSPAPFPLLMVALSSAAGFLLILGTGITLIGLSIARKNRKVL